MEQSVIKGSWQEVFVHLQPRKGHLTGKTRKGITKARGKNKCCFHACISKWPNLQVEVKNWITDHRCNGISVSTCINGYFWSEMIVKHSTTDFAGTPCCFCRIMERQRLCMHTETKIAQKVPAKYLTQIL